MGAKQVSAMKNKMSLYQTLKSSRGFNLVELMVATGISGFVALAASTMYLFIIENFRIMVDQNTAQESVLWTAYQTKNWLQQGYEFVAPVGGCNNNAVVGGATTTVNAVGKFSRNIAEGCGELYFQFDKETANGGSGDTRVAQIVVFNAHNEIDTTVGDVFFNNQNLLGKVVLFRSNDNTTLTTPQPFPTVANAVWFDRISQYDVVDDTVDAQGVTNSITVSIQTRYFFDVDNTLLNYCWPANAPCDTGLTNNSYSNITMAVNVGLRNIGYDPVNGGLHGNVYYYRFSAQPVLLGLDYN